MKKILLICAASKMVLHFRAELIKKYQSEGFVVSVVTFDDDYKKQIEGLGVECFCVGSSNRSLNPFAILSLKKRYVKIIKKVQPDVVFTFMLKPNVFGTQAAKECGVENIYSMVEGAGDAFTFTTLKWRIICKVVSALYKSALKIPKRVVFLNEDDKEEFIRRGLVDEQKPFVVPGIGVNLEEFKSPSIAFNNCFLMISRLMPAKGVREYLSAARRVKAEYPQVVFGLLGPEGNISQKDIKSYLDDGSVVYYGETDDVRPYLKNCSVFVLPSYREGFPMSIMEAQACGRSVITCDSVGCRDTVNDGYNGFLIEAKNVDLLVEKLTYFIGNPVAAKEMGENARKYAEDNFSHEHINERIFNLTAKND